MSELTFGAKLTNKPENTAKPCLFAEMESPLAHLRGKENNIINETFLNFD